MGNKIAPILHDSWHDGLRAWALFIAIMTFKTKKNH
jgi:hypothetical protein